MEALLLQTLFIANTSLFNLPVGLLESICYVESKHDIQAIHYNDGNEDSLGICQIKLSTAKWLGFKGTRKQLMDPQHNIHYSAKYLKHQIDRYSSIKKGVIAYNVGHAKYLTKSVYLDKVNKQWTSSYGGKLIYEQRNRRYYTSIENQY